MLAEAAKHDPDNALYDYFAARNIGWGTVRMQNATGRQKPFIVERDKSDEARKLVEHGLLKPLMDGPTNEVLLILDFLEQSRQPRFLIADVYLHGGIGNNSVTPVDCVYELHARQLAGPISPDEKAKAHRNTLQMVKQCEAAGTVDWLVARMKAEALGGLWDESLDSAEGALGDNENEFDRQYEAAKAEEALMH